MEPFDTYFRTEYTQDQQELRQVEILMGRVLPIFAHLFQNTTPAGWPYEVVHVGKQLQSRGPVGKENEPGYSFSTNSMILYTLAVVLGRTRSSPLSVAAPLPFPLKPSPEILTAYDKGMEALRERFIAENKTISSGTYGRNDPLTLSWLLTLIPVAQDDAGVGDGLVTIADTIVKRAQKNPARPILQLATHNDSADKKINTTATSPGDQAPSTYSTPMDHTLPVLRATQIIKQLNASHLQTNYDISVLRAYFYDKVHLHLALYTITDSDFDPAELTFALEGYLLCDPSIHVSPLIEKVFKVLTEMQERNPYWRPVRPLIGSPQGFVLLPVSIEVANSLLRICDLVQRENPTGSQYFSLHVKLFKRYFTWLATRVVELTGDISGRGSSIDCVGWSSEHLQLPDRIHLWETALVLLFLRDYAAMMQQHVARTSIERMNLTVKLS